MIPAIKWLPSPNYSARGGQAVRNVIVHDCEGNYYGSVSWFSMARSQVSAHLVMSEDGTQATQMVAFANKAWHACNFNPFSEGIEAAGYAAKGLGAPEWQALAELVAWRLKANGIPPTWAKGGIGPGFEQHIGLGAAGGGHHDITNDPDVWQAFCGMVVDSYGIVVPPTVAGVINWTPKLTPDFTPATGIRHDLQPPSLEWVQMTLNAKGYTPTLMVDGLEGPATLSVIKRFQSAYNLTVDGIAGPQTVSALASA